MLCGSAAGSTDGYGWNATTVDSVRVFYRPSPRATPTGFWCRLAPKQRMSPAALSAFRTPGRTELRWLLDTRWAMPPNGRRPGHPTPHRTVAKRPTEPTARAIRTSVRVPRCPVGVFTDRRLPDVWRPRRGVRRLISTPCRWAPKLRIVAVGRAPDEATSTMPSDCSETPVLALFRASPRRCFFAA